MSKRQELVEQALAYPYAVPSGSFLLVDGDPRDAGGLGPGGVHTIDRTPLLAYGSNAAPEVLARKLGESTRDDPVLALRATLSDFDVVYSAHISRYGSIPATLQRSPGAEAAAFVLYLTPGQLKLIAATEPNYDLAQLSGIACKLESGEALTEVAAYLSRHGCLLVEGSEIALAEVEARGRMLGEMSQPEVQEHIRTTLAPDRSLDRFIEENFTDERLARSRAKALRELIRIEARPNPL